MCLENRKVRGERWESLLSFMMKGGMMNARDNQEKPVRTYKFASLH